MVTSQWIVKMNFWASMNAGMRGNMKRKIAWILLAAMTLSIAECGNKTVDSAPMMSSIAYQCVLLRVSEDQDIEAAKKLLEENADPAKWICVEAESVVVENVGDVILFIMADKDVADAAKEAFLALKK